MAYVPLSSYYAVSPVRPTTAASRSFSSFLPIFRATVPNISSSFFISKFQGVTPQERFRCFSHAAGVDNATAAADGLAQEHIPEGGAITDNEENLKDRDVYSEQLDGNKMIRICDKLIGVFMVDKSTPTDWRRLLIFSKEWDSIRPHFYKRCQEKADGESDPGMKHKLLRLARKLKEV